MLERYATEIFAPGQQIKRWCEFGSKTTSAFAVRPYDPDGFQATVRRAAVGALGITQVETSRFQGVARGMAAGSWMTGNKGSVMLTLQKVGRCRILQGQREVTLNPGDVMFWDLGRDWELDGFEDTENLSLTIPTERLVDCLGAIEPYLIAPLHAGDSKTPLITAVIENLCRLVFKSQTELNDAAVDDLLFGAMRLAFDCHTAKSATDSDEDKQHKVFGFVDDRLRDPSITVAGLAAALGMSLRSFQRLFYMRGISPRDYILSRRIEMAAQALKEPSPRTKTRITDVALACGFNDPGYFSRVFQRRYGLSPVEYLRKNRALI